MTQEAAVALVYLMGGFDDCHRDKLKDKVDSIYERHAEKYGGHIGITNNLYEYANYVAACINLEPAQNFPGVIEYEVYEGLGEWVFHNPDADFEAFKPKAKERIDYWFNPTLNASQPVDATKKESATMKISDLISQLDSLRGDLGDVDVVVRGSKETSFVDALDVRRVKTPKRTTVFIGKAAQRTPQE